MIGFEGRDRESLIRFLGGKSAEELLSAFNDWFVPSTVDGTYLTGQPECLYKTGRIHPVDCIIGFNSSEGVGFLSDDVDTRAKAEDVIEKLIKNNFFRGHSRLIIDRIMRSVKAEYLCSENHLRDVSNFYADVNFVAPSLQQAQYHSGIIVC